MGYPKENINSLLDVQIRDFTIRNASPPEALEAIDKLPEVQAWLRKQGVSRQDFEVGGNHRSSDTLISLTLNGVKLRNVLNRLIHMTGQVNWTVVRYGDNRQYIGIYL